MTGTLLQADIQAATEDTLPIRHLLPDIDAKKCINCGTCREHCRSVLEGKMPMDIDGENFVCGVFCRLCARICPAGAITFSDEEAFIERLKKNLQTP